MSTKTSIKRIAAVAAVALTLGGFSAVSAHAATPAFVGGAVGTAVGSTGTVTAVTETFGTVSRASTTTWTVPVTLNVTGTAIGATDQFTVAGTTLTTTGNASSAIGVITKASTTATTAVLTGTITFTAATTVAAAADAYAMTLTVVDTGAGAPVAVSPVNSVTLSAGAVANVNGGAYSAAATATPVVGTYSAVNLISGIADKQYSVISTGVGTLAAPAITSVASTTAGTSGISTSGFSWFYSSVNADVIGSGTNILYTGVQTIGFSAYSATAGTQTITVVGTTSGTVATVTLTWGAAPVVTAQYSTAYMAPVAVVLPVTSVNAAAVVASAAVVNGAPVAVANITVTLNSAAATIIAGKPLTAVITGAGVVGIGDTNTAGVATGTNVSTTAAQVLTNTSGIYTVTVYSSGVAGTATITLSSGAVVLGTKTVTFYASGSKAVATQNLFVANKAGGLLGKASSNADMTLTTVAGKYAYTVDVTDANGNAAAGSTVKAVSSNTAVIQSSVCTQSLSTPGTYNCDVTSAVGALSGQSADVTFEIYNAATAAYDILANPLTFKVGGVIASETLTTDSSSYSYLAPIKLTVTAKDSAGNFAYDQDQPTGLVTSLVSSVALSNPAGLVSPIRLINGVGSVTGFYAPATVGDFTITALDNVSLAGEALSVTATAVGTSADASAQAAIDAAQEATDAANAAYDAANNAMDSADAATAAAQDASDNASAALAAVTSLSATVAKLVKSVAALATALTSIKKKLGVK